MPLEAGECIPLASDACERGSALHTMATKITQFAFDELDAPPVVVGSRNWITPADEVEDAFFPMYREYGVQFQRGVHMHEVLLFWGGDERGNCFKDAPAHDFAWCVPIATQFHHATGAATAFKYRKEKRAAVTVIGDGGTSQGDFYESMNCAGAWKLPDGEAYYAWALRDAVAEVRRLCGEAAHA